MKLLEICFKFELHEKKTSLSIIFTFAKKFFNGTYIHKKIERFVKLIKLILMSIL
jgi:hypothetical protein